MANTVTLLSYANTFGDWVVTTNALVQENNNLAANNYIKPTGTLYLNDPTLGLQVANNAVVAGQLQVQGTGSSAYVQNNMRVDQQVYFTNTTLGLVNSGQANIGGPLLALGANNGLQVSNNAIVGGNVIISGSEIIGGTLNVTSNTTVNGSITVANNSTFTNNLAVLGAITSPLITGSVSVTTPTLNVLSSAVIAGPLLALGANNGLQVSNNATIGGPLLALGANNGLQVSNNATIGGNIIITGNESIGGTLSVTGNTTVNGSLTVANNSTFTNNLAVLGAITSPSITGSVSVTTPTLTVLSGATVYGQLQVAGNFVLTGTTVYSTNTLTLNANSNAGITSTFGVNRGVNADAAIRWNESTQYWDIRDVNNPTSYSRILTANLVSDSLTSQLSSPYAASQLAANTLNNSIINLNSYLLANVTSLQNQIANNTSSLQSQITSNVNSINANTANLSAYLQSQITNNTTSLQSQITNNTTSLQNQITNNNTSLQNQITANVAYIAGVDVAQNTTISALTTYAQSGYNRANNSSQIFVGTTGSASPTGGIVSFIGPNGIAVTGSSNTLSISTSQDLRTSASPTFTGLTINGSGSFSSPVTVPTATTGTNTTQAASTAFVINQLNSGGTFGINISGTSAYLGGLALQSSGAAPTTSQVLRSDSSGYAYLNYINSNTTNNENPTVSQVITTTGTDGFYRKSGIGSFTTQLTGTAPSLTAGLSNGVNQNPNRTDSTWYQAVWSNAAGGDKNVYSTGNVTISSGPYGGLGFYGSNWTLGGNPTYGLATNTGLYVSGQIWSTSNITAYYSDMRLKKYLGPIEKPLDKIMSLNGFYYEANETAQALGYTAKREVGVSAQDVQAIMPEIVSPAPIDNQYLTIDYERLVPLLIESIKALKLEIDELKKK